MSYTIPYETALAPSRGAAIVAFLEDFYRTSDTEALHDKYVDSFTDDATLIMGPREARGASVHGGADIESEIKNLRHAIWTHVASRKHSASRIFFGGENEIMLYGDVVYRLKADPETDVRVPWAGRVVFAPQKEDEGVKMQYYQVYLDPSAQSGKK